MIEIILVRHVKVDGPAALYGRTDIAADKNENNKLLTELSERYNSDSGALLDLIISSPLQRCRLLAEQLSKQINIPMDCIEELQEMDFGQFDGLAFDQLVDERSLNTEIEGPWSTLEGFWQAPAQATLPNAESLIEFHQRVVLSWKKLAERAIKNNQKKILVLCHGGVIRIILAEILALNWQNPTWYQALKIDYASSTKVTVSTEANNTSSYHCLVNHIGLPLITNEG